MASKTLENLEQFTGTEHWYRHRINRAVLYIAAGPRAPPQGCPRCDAGSGAR
jgi:hypothetical protein